MISDQLFSYLLSCHLAILLSYHLAILLSCHLAILLSYHLAILLSCHLAILLKLLSRNVIMNNTLHISEGVWMKVQNRVPAQKMPAR